MLDPHHSVVVSLNTPVYATIQARNYTYDDPKYERVQVVAFIYGPNYGDEPDGYVLANGRLMNTYPKPFDISIYPIPTDGNINNFINLPTIEPEINWK